jgi:GMP synthase-like glutamine amidotransferase
MRIACLQHASFETPGNIAVWAEARGHVIATTHLYRGDPLPNLADFDLLVVMGGPMSVNDESEHAWLAPEKELIRQCVAANQFVLGVCLGSQLIANALGSRVYRNHAKEIGWMPLTLLPAASESALAKLPQQLEVFQWHGETYDLPPGCTHLAQSEACRIQAFDHPHALALQFHLEVTEDCVKGLIRHCASDIGAGQWEQPREKLIEGEAKNREAARAALFDILDSIETRITR